jgi:5'-nucleotidase
MTEIASRLRNRPDLIVGGHVHGVVNIRPSGVPLLQAGQYGTHLSVTDLERVSPDSVAVRADLVVAYADSVIPDVQIAAMVARYAADIGPILDRVIASFGQPMTRRGNEHPLGNLIADAQRHATGTQVAIMNNGGIRTDLLAGPARYEDLFRLQPFANTLVVMDLTGAQLLQAIEQSLQGPQGAHFSGVRVRYRPDGEPGRRIVSANLDTGAVIVPTATYRVVTNNFLAEGGDGFAMLRDGSNVRFTGIVDLDALIEYLATLPSPVPMPPGDRVVPVAR